jgi:hypothetical protein
MTRFMGKNLSSSLSEARPTVLTSPASWPGKREFHNMALVVQPRKFDPVDGDDPERLG